MMQSEQINEIASALAVAQGEFPILEKKSKAYNYKYADLPETLQAIQEPLKKNGLAISHQQMIMEGADILVTKLMHSSGQWISTHMPLVYKSDAKVNPMQALGSAITYAKRYSIGSLLNLAADKEMDDDGEKSSPKIVESPSYIHAKVNIPSITFSQQEVIEDYLAEFPEAKKDLLSRFGVSSVAEIPGDKYHYVVSVFEKKKKARDSHE